MPSPNIVAYSDFGPIIINVNDNFIGRAVTLTGMWEQGEISLIIALVKVILKSKPSIMVYDVGANIGTHSLALAKTFGETIRIRAFEAQRPIFNMLNGTLALNDLMTVKTYNNAVSDKKDDVLRITLPDYHRVNNFGGLELMPPRISDNQAMYYSTTEDVRTITLDDFDEVVDFIKMDIEGMEDQALRGAARLFEAHSPLCFIEIRKTDRNFVLGFLKGRNYIGYKMGDNLVAIPKQLEINLNLERLF